MAKFHVLAAAALAFAGAAFAAEPAQAQLQIQVQTWSSGSQVHRGPAQYRAPARQIAPQGYFTVNARACPQLGAQQARMTSRANHRRGQSVAVTCPSQAFNYVPSRQEVRFGYDARRMQTNRARWDARSRSFVADTRYGVAPVRVVDAPVRHVGYAWRR